MPRQIPGKKILAEKRRDKQSTWERRENEKMLLATKDWARVRKKLISNSPCRCVRQGTDLIYSSSREMRKEVHEYPRRSYGDICGELNEGSRKSPNTKAMNLSYQSIFYQRVICTWLYIFFLLMYLICVFSYILYVNSIKKYI